MNERQLAHALDDIRQPSCDPDDEENDNRETIYAVVRAIRKALSPTPLEVDEAMERAFPEVVSKRGVL